MKRKKLTPQERIEFCDFAINDIKSRGKLHRGICGALIDYIDAAPNGRTTIMKTLWPELFKEIEERRLARYSAWAWNMYDVDERVAFLTGLKEQELLNLKK